jgi:ATP-dependent RNA helicase DeaD
VSPGDRLDRKLTKLRHGSGIRQRPALLIGYLYRMTPRNENSVDGFPTLGLDERLLASLTALGYEEPTPIQRAAIPPLLEGHDVLAQAATGTGKTAAFALPLLHLITPDAPTRERTAALVLVPTRELAMQVAEAVHKYGKPLGVIAVPIYGGASMEGQIRTLKRGVDIVVATPGRALDHIRRRTLHLAAVKMVVLDEADEMLDMGFAEDLEAILAATPPERQTALFSATLPPRISAIAAKHLRKPVTIRIEREAVAAGTLAKVRQVAYIVARANKTAALSRVLDVEQPVSTIVFCRTRTEVDELTESLNAHGYRAEALHGGLNQEQRDRVMKKFRANKTDLLIATDVAARGLDVQHVSHVVNFDVPSAAEAYVHRIGRTGRAGRAGVAITFAEPREPRMLRNIELLTKQKIEIAAVPTVADLRERRLETVRTSLRDTIVAGGLEAYRAVVESLAAEFDMGDIAAAAVKRAESPADEKEEAEIPSALTRPAGSSAAHSAAHSGPRATLERSRAPKPGTAKKGRPGELAGIYIGGGRKLKIRPGDIVGAIVNEAKLSAESIGSIQIAERHSTVLVPKDIVDHVIAALNSTSIKGKKLVVRRDRA